MKADASRGAEASPHTTEPTRGERTGRRKPRLSGRSERDGVARRLRVVGIGVQVMSGFLLSIPVANRFVKLDHTERGIYLVTIVLAALSTAPLAAPVAYHRTLSRRHQKGSLVPGDQPAGHRGLVTVGRAICSAVLLVTSFARRRKVDGRSSMNKAQLQQALGR